MFLHGPMGDVSRLFVHPIDFGLGDEAKPLQLVHDGLPVERCVIGGELLGIITLEAVQELDELAPLRLHRGGLHQVPNQLLEVVDAVGQVLDDFLGVLVSVD
ncbi:hypothetical protein D9M70_650260 [compost metagenome]